MAISWNAALEQFKAAHPDVTVQFEQKSWDQIQKAGSLILNSDDTPDVMEYNKGNATAGLVASNGLLTDLTSVAADKGWDKTLSASTLALGRYDENGIFGSGPLIGIPTYGEFVSVFYNKDMFAANNIQVPTTLADFESAMDAFVAKGITPLALAANDYPAQHLLYALALSNADANWVTNYQGVKAPLDTAPYLAGAQTMQDWVAKGYVTKDATGIKGDGANALFTSGKSPMVYQGTWMDGEFKTQIKNFEWGQFLFPGNTFSPGSTGNIWVVPESAKNKDLAYEFINLTLSTDNQNLMGNSGGVPVAADPSGVTDPVGQQLTTAFNTLATSNGLGFYPDWPVPGFYDVMLAKTQGVVGGTLTPQEFVDEIAAPYNKAQSAG
jgi:raffinose/stachyose/melibiose transport system substrate-binding protein